MDSLDNIVEMHELRLQTIAALYDLSDKRGRNNSAKALAELFFGLTKILGPEIFIEAGAKEASASQRVRTLLPNAEIHAFEANPENYELYASKTKFKEQNIKYIHKAVASKPGKITFNIPKVIGGTIIEKNTGQSSILKRADHFTEYAEVQVDCVSLDTMFPASPKNSLWIDVEGATSEAILGAANLLKNTSVAIVEMSDKPHWEGEWLATTVIKTLLQDDLIPVARDFEYISQYNIVFVKRSYLQNHDVRSNIQYFYSNLSKREYPL